MERPVIVALVKLTAPLAKRFVVVTLVNVPLVILALVPV